MYYQGLWVGFMQRLVWLQVTAVAAIYRVNYPQVWITVTARSPTNDSQVWIIVTARSPTNDP